MGFFSKLFSSKPSDYDRKQVKVCGTRVEAEMYSDMLKQSGIPSIIMANDVGRTHPEFNLAGGVRILVDPEDYAKACEILQIETV